MPKTATYLFCVIAAARRPRVPAKTRPLPGLGPVRILDVDGGTYLVVADAPLSRYGEDAINRGLADLEWVSAGRRGARIGHRNRSSTQTAILPMKLFTIFTSDARALSTSPGSGRGSRRWSSASRTIRSGVFAWCWIERQRSARRRLRSDRGARPRLLAASGAAYLTRKKAQRDAAVELASRARDIVAGLHDRLEARSKLAKRRAASELPVKGGPLLLDAAFLVPKGARPRSRRWRRARLATLARQGYAMAVTRARGRPTHSCRIDDATCAQIEREHHGLGSRARAPESTVLDRHRLAC